MTIVFTAGVPTDIEAALRQILKGNLEGHGWMRFEAKGDGTHRTTVRVPAAQAKAALAVLKKRGHKIPPRSRWQRRLG
jgi:hypothetical protein